MILNNVKMALTGDPVNIRVSDGKIEQVLPHPIHDTTEQFTLSFDNAIIFPGLINSHDHLDFNLFPALGGKNYKNYTEWGRHIHKACKENINSILNIPGALREQWGVYKNLLCGVTTVVNHGKKIKEQSWPISVYEECQSIHSVQFERKWKLSLNNPFKKKLPVVVHVGEGVDESSFKEIDRLISWNLLKRPVIGVHGIAMNETQVSNFKALVWCPESNYFLLNKTAPVNRLKKHTNLLFGTDSTLTGRWNIWEHIRLARKTKFLTDRELYDTLTGNAALAWDINSGAIAEGKDADIVVARMKNNVPAEAFFGINPQDILLVMHQGKISLFDEELYTRLKGIDLDKYSRTHIDGTCKYVLGNLPGLMYKIKQYYPEAQFPVL